LTFSPALRAVLRFSGVPADFAVLPVSLAEDTPVTLRGAALPPEDFPRGVPRATAFSDIYRFAPSVSVAAIMPVNRAHKPILKEIYVMCKRILLILQKRISDTL
jgi:hypothetical protein